MQPAEEGGKGARRPPPLKQRVAVSSQASSLSHRDGELEEVPNFSCMRSSDFREYASTHPTLLHDGSALGPGSMKHASWAGSDRVPPVGLQITFFVLLVLLIAATVGVSVGFTVRPTGGVWGWVSGAIILAASGVLFLAVLIAYMAAYSSGLKTERTKRWVERLGFGTNVSANVVCRYIMTCCFNRKFNIFGMSTR